MERHQRNDSANGKILNYMQQTYRYPSDFSTVLYASQLLQADAIRYGVEYTIHDLQSKGAVVHPDTLELYDEIVLSEGNGGQANE